MKVGDLVRRHSSGRIGVVVEEIKGYIKVCWSSDYGTFWANQKAVEVLSARR